MRSGQADSEKPSLKERIWSRFKYFIVGPDKDMPAGEHQVRMEFKYEGGGLGKGGVATLFVEGKKAGEEKLASGWRPPP